MTSKKELIHLDFHEYDTAEALEYLAGLVREGQVSGMIFAVTIKKGRRPLFGATGLLASNGIMAAGLAAILEDQFTQPFLMCSGSK